MSDPIAMIIRFTGDPDELLGLFERARAAWTEAHEGYVPPAFFATCRAEEGIVVITGWHAEEDHAAFRRQMGRHLRAVGMGMPDGHERLRIARLG